VPIITEKHGCFSGPTAVCDCEPYTSFVMENVLELPGFNQQIACREGVMLYNRNDGFAGRMLRLYGEFCQSEVALFEQIVRPGAVVIDAGANIGALTLAFSRMVGPTGLVIAYEIDRYVFQTLCANVALNSLTNVVCVGEMLTEQSGYTQWPCMDPVNARNFGGLNDDVDKSHGEPIRMTMIDERMPGRCDLIKADVEGMELEVLRGGQQTIARYRPFLYVENNPGSRQDQLIEYIDSIGYRMYWHLAPMYNPNNFLKNSDNIYGDGHAHNMLCIPVEMKIDSIDLKRVEVPTLA
jgi:FkbM family methyltransferase